MEMGLELEVAGYWVGLVSETGLEPGSVDVGVRLGVWGKGGYCHRAGRRWAGCRSRAGVSAGLGVWDGVDVRNAMLDKQQLGGGERGLGVGGGGRADGGSWIQEHRRAPLRPLQGSDF